MPNCDLKHLRGVLIVAGVKLEEKDDKNLTLSITFTLLTRNFADKFPLLENHV